MIIILVINLDYHSFSVTKQLLFESKPNLRYITYCFGYIKINGN